MTRRAGRTLRVIADRSVSATGTADRPRITRGAPASNIVDEERFVLAAGATVIARRGSRPGIEAETRPAFLAVRVGSDLDDVD